MTFACIRKQYGVPARRGTRIRFSGRADSPPIEGTITSAAGAYLRVHYDGESRLRRHYLHPSWEIEYLPPASADDG
jgi:hypothetical protein